MLDVKTWCSATDPSPQEFEAFARIEIHPEVVIAMQGAPVLLLTFQLPKQTQISRGPKAMLGQLKSLKLAKSLKSRLHTFIAKLDSYQGQPSQSVASA